MGALSKFSVEKRYELIDKVSFMQDGFVATLDPKQDITPYESMHITIMLSYGNAKSTDLWDYKSYIEQHNLQRHFVIKHV